MALVSTALGKRFTMNTMAKKNAREIKAIISLLMVTYDP